MDIDILSGIIRELIIDNDKVPVRGMGYFISEPCKASLSEDKRVVYPPSRHISFRSDEDVSEDMLERYYSKLHNVDLETIKVEFDLFIKELKSLLLNKKSVTFAGLGVMRSTIEGNIYFVTDDRYNFLSSAIPMKPVSVKEINNLQEKEAVENDVESEHKDNIGSVEVVQKDEREEDMDEKIEMNPQKRYKMWVIVLLIIIATLALFILFLLFINMGVFDSLLYSRDELELIRKSALL